MRNRVGAMLATVVLVVLGAGTSASAHRPRSSAHAHRAPARLTPAESTGAFGLDLLRRFPAGNVILSPDSVETALAMLGEGARGQTAAQIAHVSHLPAPSSFAGLGGLQATLALEAHTAAGSDPEAPRLAIANGLFVQEGFGIDPQFLTSLETGFGAAPVPLDFAGHSPEAVQAINEWVSGHTEGVIPRILGQLEAATRLVLANAIYLNARWASPFKPQAVFPGTFHAASGGQRVPFMHESEMLPYVAGSGYRAVELPYRSSTLSMLVVMPTGHSLARLQGGLTAPALAAVARSLKQREVEVSLPKFHVSFESELGETLERLGMPLAFSEAADLSGISACRCLTVGSVVHAADIRVKEDGTVAAAATVIAFEASSFERRPRAVPFVADHPFLFFLRDDRTGAVLFAGRLADAAAAQS